MIFVANILLIVYGAFVGQQLWAWHVAPVFGVALLTLWQVFALRVTIGFFTLGAADLRALVENTESPMDSAKRTLTVAVAYTLILAFGYLAKIAQ